jgi:hypothetical protein
MKWSSIITILETKTRPKNLYKYNHYTTFKALKNYPINKATSQAKTYKTPSKILLN